MVLPSGCVGGICAFQARPVRAIFVPPLWVVLGSGLRRAAACGCSGVLGRQTRPRRAAGPVTSLGPCPSPASVMRLAPHRPRGDGPTGVHLGQLAPRRPKVWQAGVLRSAPYRPRGRQGCISGQGGSPPAKGGAGGGAEIGSLPANENEGPTGVHLGVGRLPVGQRGRPAGVR